MNGYIFAFIDHQFNLRIIYLKILVLRSTTTTVKTARILCFFGDFNMTETEEQLKHCLDLHSLKNLVKEPTCYKSHTPKCIDLVLTNRNRSVQKTATVKTGLSDFHKMVVTVLTTTFPKQGRPTVINYRNYKKYNENVFKSDLQEELQKIDPSDLNYSSFETAFDRVLDKHAPIKKKYVRANDKPLMTRSLR